MLLGVYKQNFYNSLEVSKSNNVEIQIFTGIWKFCMNNIKIVYVLFSKVLVIK